MIRNCANPSCGVPLRYLRNGRLFQFEVRDLNHPENGKPSARAKARLSRQVAHFWLCGDCCTRMTLSFDPIRGVQVVPLVTHVLPHSPESRTTLPAF